MGEIIFKFILKYRHSFGDAFLCELLNGLCEKDSIPTERPTAFIFVFYTDVAPLEHFIVDVKKKYSD